MSEPLPDDFPLSPDEVRRVLENMGKADGAPDFMTTAIETVAAVHAQWYRAWQAAGVPEHRAAEWTAVLIRAQVQA